MNTAIPKETKTKEYRVALVPEHVRLLTEVGHTVFIEQDAGLGAGFTNEEYQKAGAQIINSEDKEEIYQKEMVVRVKEPPLDTLENVPNNQVIMGYLHIEKGQNPELKQKLLEKNVTSYALEEIKDPETKHRLVSLGFEAGIVGMFEGLRNYGIILEKQGKDNPFKNVKSMWNYPNKAEAYLALRDINPRDFTANVCIAGYGKVSKGAQEVLAQLSHPPLVLREEDTVRTKILGKDFTYIWKHLSDVDIFVNAIVWHPGQSRVLNKEDLKLMRNNSLIVDISCDECGGIETCQATSWEQPTYVYETKNGKKIIHYCVDNLPSALAHDVSIVLSRMVYPFVLKVANGEELSSGLMTKEGKFVYKP